MVDSEIKFLDEELKQIEVPLIAKESIKRIKPCVATGKFGKVYKGYWNDKTVAIKKIIDNNVKEVENNKKDLLREIENMKFASKDCEQVPNFFGIWKGHHGRKYHLIFEFLEGITLREMIPKLNFKEKLMILLEINVLMNYFHQKKFFHRDLKPENIMVTPEKKVKLIDFGTARLASQTITFTSAAQGTAFYMAPDNFQIDEEEEHNDEKVLTTGPKVDVWSIGCMMSEMLTGVFPWSNKTKIPRQVESFLVLKTQFPLPDAINKEFPEFKELFGKIFQINPKDRCSCQDIIDFLKEKIASMKD